MKKFLAVVLAATMVCALPVAAAKSPSAPVVADQAKAAEQTVSAADAAVAAAAADAGMSVGEYRNNTVVSIPGVEQAYPVGQGGHIVLNGAPSNLTFPLSKVNQATVDSAVANGAAAGGQLISVFKTSSAVKFQTAQVNYYVKGIQEGQTVRVFMLVDGVWTEVEVLEVREDHVILNQTAVGPLAFYLVG